MIASILSPAVTAAVQQMNRRGNWNISPVSGRTVNEILKAIEGIGEYRYVLIDIEAVRGNIETAIAVIERLRKTTTAEIVVIAQGHDPDGTIARDIQSCGIPAEHILTENITIIKRQLQQILPAQESITLPVSAAELREPGTGENAETRQPALDQAVVPPSQISRGQAKQSLIFKPPILSLHSRAVVIAVAGSGSRVGTTTQAMQILHYLHSRDRKACIVEMHGRKELSLYLEVADTKDVTLIDSSHFRLYHCDIFQHAKSFLHAKRDFDFVIQDYGEISEIADVTAFLDKEIKVVVSGVKPSESDRLNTVFDIDDGSIHYIFSFVSPTEQPAIRRAMRESAGNTHFAVYSPDFFTYCGDDETYGNLLQLDAKAVLEKESLIERVKGVFTGGK